ncbi:MAG: YcbK family protein [Pikeienuella sp.]
MNTSDRQDRCVSRRFVLGGLAGLALTPAAPAIAKGAGDFRSVNLVNNRTGEWINTVYWVEGAYIDEALGAISHLMRDWRAEQKHPIAPATIDIIAATHRLLECSEPFEVISGYRTPQTNAMLRRKSRGVARNSYHVKAMAVDLTLHSRTPRQIAGAAKSLTAGGVGTYSRAEFVHLDSGPVRDWGR